MSKNPSNPENMNVVKTSGSYSPDTPTLSAITRSKLKIETYSDPLDLSISVFISDF